jgi:hypothetical protein
MVKTFVIFAFILQLFSAPKTYQVKDSVTHETLCGVAVKVDDNTVYTDMDGRFEYRPNKQARVSLISYNDTTVNLSNNVIYLSQVK